MDFESSLSPFLQSELTRTNQPMLRDAMAAYSTNETPFVPRSYPGYPEWLLPTMRPRLLTSLEHVVKRRRSKNILGNSLPNDLQLSRILWFSHGLHDPSGQGPVPSAGGLGALHLYAVVFPSQNSNKKEWLPEGVYYYQRQKHGLSQLIAMAKREEWVDRIPSLRLMEGGRIVWIVVGDAARVIPKYTFRAYRYLLLEAGHLMQNLCLLSTSVKFTTVPLGGFFESEIAKTLFLPRTDVVLYAGILGSAAK